MTIQEFDLFKAVNIVADFADWDTTARLNHSLRAYCNYDDSEFFPYETLLGKTMNIMSGIISSLSYMHLSIYQISHQDLNEELEIEGYTEYDLYRYHYIVFSHSVALLQDLMFKLTAEIFCLNVPQRMIGWKKLEKELRKHSVQCSSHLRVLLCSSGRCNQRKHSLQCWTRWRESSNLSATGNKRKHGFQCSSRHRVSLRSSDCNQRRHSLQCL